MKPLERLFGLLTFGLAPALVFGQATPTVNQAPPPGIRVPAAEAAELNAQLENLGKAIETLQRALQGDSDSLALLPDVQIFHKSVRDALVHDEFFKPREVDFARQQLATGRERAAALGKRMPTWTTARGSLVRAYRSRIDDSVQPYGLRVPEDWRPGEEQRRPLYLWFHGRNDTLSEVAFIASQANGQREFAPAPAFELHLYGRYCNASKFAGEMDAFEAMEDVMRHYRIDTNRIAALGFSMGGASAWHLAAHYPGTWAAASAGAGFAETAIYANVFAAKKEAPPAWEQTLWRLYDATAYAANFANLPMIAYSGELDPQKQSADIMEKAMAEEGLKLERLIGPKTAHKYEPDTKRELSKRMDEAMAKGRDPFPRRVRFVTYTLRYNQMKWITLNQLERHWTRAEVEAQLDGDDLRVKTRNITAFTVALPDKLLPRHVLIDGDDLGAAAPANFCRLAGKWQRAPPDFGRGLHKRQGLTGPIDDAFMGAFLLVRPTGTAWNEKVGVWAASELERALVEWRRVFRGDARVKKDHEITADDIARYNLVLWGDPGSNRLLTKILPELPLKWTRQELVLGVQRVSASDHAPILIFPNPLNQDRYIVINSGFTFRQGSTTSNSQQTPKLPDWAIVHLRVSPSLKWPGRVASAGFFDDQWQVSSP